MPQDEALGNGTCLPILSVQEIVRSDAENVPERYIRNPDNRPNSTEISLVPDDHIPVIDFSLLAQGDEEERRKLEVACKEWSFFQIINHGVEEAIPKMKAAAAQFFDLPLSEKKKYAMPPDYFEGYGQDNKAEDKKRDWMDLLWLLTMPAHSRNTKYWPLAIPGFQESVEEYATEMQRVTYEILGNLSLLMGLERDFLKELHGEVKQGTRMNYYPACARPDLVYALSPHCDYTSISFILQDFDITALQIKHNEMWVPVKPIPNAISVLVGDVMESWSNGKYKSLPHRVVANVEKPRYGIISFVIPSNEAKLDPLKTMVDDDHPPLYKNGLTYIEYLLYTQTKETEEDKYVNIDYLKIQN
ncbi:probable 2-oxoglutarate/Fe(II)-dependent dioxygenase [Sesamum indicum]|uniref:Probable 2-oxoglutarate/Fe(II)-dependent dioxygenase n=1 Tax=Sesamum indicum TaxID=4182 RepID=A0A6I9T083_SESIN|nr:probable 2-oxoglutarate/Fe(II)-dependent dioxygenase [Sesamum indicum]